MTAYLGRGQPRRPAFEADYPIFASFDQQWPGLDSKMTWLMNQVQSNLGNYLAWQHCRASGCSPGSS